MSVIERARAALTYDAELGTLTWTRSGKRAGTLNRHTGYRYVCFEYKLYKEHRLIWAILYGYFPTADIDHINRVRDDNSLINLRECSRSFNLLNTDAATNISTGQRGVHLQKNGRYHAYGNVGKKRTNIGYFATLAEAVTARAAWLKQHKDDT